MSRQCCRHFQDMTMVLLRRLATLMTTMAKAGKEDHEVRVGKDDKSEIGTMPIVFFNLGRSVPPAASTKLHRRDHGLKPAAKQASTSVDAG